MAVCALEVSRGKYLETRTFLVGSWTLTADAAFMRCVLERKLKDMFPVTTARASSSTNVSDWDLLTQNVFSSPRDCFVGLSELSAAHIQEVLYQSQCHARKEACVEGVAYTFAVYDFSDHVFALLLTACCVG
jgi:hypothetical protein